jgi:hypothetical protein
MPLAGEVVRDESLAGGGAAFLAVAGTYLELYVINVRGLLLLMSSRSEWAIVIASVCANACRLFS